MRTVTLLQKHKLLWCIICYGLTNYSYKFNGPPTDSFHQQLYICNIKKQAQVQYSFIKYLQTGRNWKQQSLQQQWNKIEIYVSFCILCLTVDCWDYFSIFFYVKDIKNKK